MDKNGSVIVLLFLFLIVFSRSNAFDSRKLVANPDRNSSTNANQDSPPPNDKKPDLSSVEVSKSNDSPNISSSNVESTDLNDANTKKSSENFGDLELDHKKNKDGKETEAFTRKSCKGLPVCRDQEKTMSACIQDFVNGSNNLTLVVQNEKDVDLKVNITFGTSMNNFLSNFELPAHGTKEVNITFSGDKSNKVILNAGNGDCELQVRQAKTTPVDGSSKSKDPKSSSNVEDVINPAKPKEENSPSKDNKGDSPSKSKGVDTPSKSKDAGNPEKSKDAGDLPKSKDVKNSTKSKDSDPSRSKDIDDPSKSKNVDDPSKSKEVNDPSKSKSTDVNDPSKSKDTGPPSNPKTSVNTPMSQNNFLDQLTFYSKQVTPVYGAYLAFLIALIIGGSWALCSLRQRRTGNGVAYQELEMGPTEPSNAVDEETTEGWEHDWDDDDWDDEDKAIRSPGSGIQTKSISSNGLTSRATKKESWDADWDD